MFSWICCADQGGEREPVAVQTCKAVSSDDGPVGDAPRARGAPMPEEPKEEPERPVMTLSFLMKDSCEREVVVTRRPLGVDFKKEMPLKVKHVRPGSAGAELNIEAEWVITKVNGETIQDLAFQAAYDKLKKGLAAVPGP
uniref:PDZ domain-containing protein n=1 Tax=Alexandrium catenella TaxID=2925 RepID=A0A7S1LQ47_ALECA|mmetsp:Transcript_118309/g.314858  ORF Transcript_118309/g.314858 Transcript_118309/m.314858 type:complete len:140 (+) Transcript_118309:57-476(+)